jgi:hypothetical protein
VSIPLREEKMLRFFLPNGIVITTLVVVVFLARLRRDLGKPGTSNGVSSIQIPRVLLRQMPEKRRGKSNYLVVEISYLYHIRGVGAVH